VVTKHTHRCRTTVARASRVGAAAVRPLYGMTALTPSPRAVRPYHITQRITYPSCTPLPCHLRHRPQPPPFTR
jgi:hypothetical protein